MGKYGHILNPTAVIKLTDHHSDIDGWYEEIFVFGFVRLLCNLLNTLHVYIFTPIVYYIAVSHDICPEQQLYVADEWNYETNSVGYSKNEASTDDTYNDCSQFQKTWKRRPSY